MSAKQRSTYYLIALVLFIVSMVTVDLIINLRPLFLIPISAIVAIFLTLILRIALGSVINRLIDRLTVDHI